MKTIIAILATALLSCADPNQQPSALAHDDAAPPCSPASAAAPAPQPAGIRHPGAIVSAQQLAYVKANIAQEPFASAIAKAKASKWGSLSYKPAGPPSDGVIECGAYSSPNHGCSTEDDDSTAALTQALLWVYTGNHAYAANAITIMNTYAKGLTGGHTNSNGPLQAAWTGEKFPAAAEVIRYSGAGWSDADFAAFQSMWRKQYLPSLATANFKGKNGNWTLSATHIDGSVLLDDAAALKSAVSQLDAVLPAYFYSYAYDGTKPATHPLVSTSWNGQTVFSASTSGVGQETCRDLQHMQFGLAAALAGMETAYVQGTDLFRPNAVRMVGTLEMHAKLLPKGFMVVDGNGESVAAPASICGGHVTAVLEPTFEIGYTAYALREGVPMPATKAHLADVRALTYRESGAAGENHGMVFETLHHGGTP